LLTEGQALSSTFPGNLYTWRATGVAAVRMKLKLTVIRLAILLLACFLIVLGVAANHSRFLPKSNPAHFLAKAAKMEEGNSQVLSTPLATQAIPDILPVPAEVCTTVITRPAKFVTSQIWLDPLSAASLSAVLPSIRSAA